MKCTLNPTILIYLGKLKKYERKIKKKRKQYNRVNSIKYLNPLKMCKLKQKLSIIYQYTEFIKIKRHKDSYIVMLMMLKELCFVDAQLNYI